VLRLWLSLTDSVVADRDEGPGWPRFPALKYRATVKASLRDEKRTSGREAANPIFQTFYATNGESETPRYSGRQCREKRPNEAASEVES
jgi:hypothetical protein